MKNRVLDINISRISNFIDRHIESVPPLKGGVPPFSSIEFSNNGLCNRRCVFCPRVDESLFPNKNDHLSLEIFKETMNVISEVNYCGRISFSGFCEPLMTKNLEDYIEYGKRTCPDMTIEISSNGDLITEKRLESLFSSGLDNIRISLYDGPHFGKKFEDIKSKLKLTDRQFIIRNRYLTAEQNYGLTISNRAGAVVLKNEHVTLFPLNEPLNQPCYYPFYKMMVDYNGDVIICSNDWLKKLVVGNLHDKTVIDIWNSEAFNMVRKKLISNNRDFSPCSVCDVNGLYNGNRHFDAWVSYYEENKQ